MIMNKQAGYASINVLIRYSNLPPNVACTVQKLTAADANLHFQTVDS